MNLNHNKLCYLFPWFLGILAPEILSPETKLPHPEKHKPKGDVGLNTDFSWVSVHSLCQLQLCAQAIMVIQCGPDECTSSQYGGAAETNRPTG